MPRESSVEQLRVLREWIRVIRPGGLVFIAQHSFFNTDVELVLRDADWVKTNVLGGERPSQPGTTGFQIRHSSG